ncbi:MAG TPA: asparagine synthase (glutamine-hydrolyzing), partial [Rhodothermales bacterium]|nr:asparagine synthase (glutamine-hydrolyzing) [Rhodothermales bacterium]
MCGITGFWSREVPSYEPRETLEMMISTLSHRGPDDEGRWSDPDGRLHFGHTRLSVIDLSAEGHQPMVSRSGRFVITFNGEIFNFEDLKKDLGSSGWRGHSDTEVMLAAIEQWGVERAVAHFNGQFAFALWDTFDRVLFLVRDRIGIKPLYFGQFNETIVFGSELKALRSHPEFVHDLSPQAVVDFLELGYVPSPLSIYSNVQKLPPGHILKLTRPGALVETVPFWSAREVVAGRDPHRGTDAEIVDDLEALLRDSVRMRLVADVPVGAFLSGGIDSSLITSLMTRESRGKVRTFSIGFEEAEYDESPYATDVASHLGTDHTNLYVTSDDVQDLLTELPRMYDEPLADVSQLPTALVSRLARKSVTVSLSGDGGDELFGGYSRYERAIRYWRLVSKIPSLLRRLAKGVAGPTAAFESSKFGMDASFALSRSLLRPAMPGQFARQIELVGSADGWEFYNRGIRLNAGSLTSGALRGKAADDLPPAFRSFDGLTFLESMQLTDLQSYLPDDILVKVDRASMDVALEVRVPLLDHRVVEYSWQVPERLK